MTIREVLRTAFKDMYELEAQMMDLYEKWAMLLPKKWIK